MRRPMIVLGFILVFSGLGLMFVLPEFIYFLPVVILVGGVILWDAFQVKRSILRNFPLLGRLRYFFELIRPEIQQYFVESNSDGVPFSREKRSIVYQRAKKELSSLPFGTQKNVYEPGYEWLNHSIVPKHLEEHLRFTIGGKDCTQPYDASLINTGAMSYGSLSKTAVMALSEGAKIGGFAVNTGEGGVSPYHLESGGDLIWQVGTGYFGCRSEEGGFDGDKFAALSVHPHIKMIELKISQGAKPGHGGILPGKKVTPEIAEIRGVPQGRDVLSPPYHKAFNTPLELCALIAKMRTLSAGKPIGLKLCIGRRHEFVAMCKAFLETGISPDYICIDGGEGGTGAAPLEFSNHIGFPLIDGLSFAHNILRGFDLRKSIKVIASGRAVTGFDIIKFLAMGADGVYMARSMMMAVGCIQALKCHSNECPTGVATQDPGLYHGLVVSDKRLRVAKFHEETMKSVCHMLGAMGLHNPDDLIPRMIMRRYDHSTVHTYEDLFGSVEDGVFKVKNPEKYDRVLRISMAKDFDVHYENL